MLWQCNKSNDINRHDGLCILTMLVCVWFDPNESAGGIESFEDYVGQNNQLYKDFVSWHGSFYENDEKMFN